VTPSVPPSDTHSSDATEKNSCVYRIVVSFFTHGRYFGFSVVLSVRNTRNSSYTWFALEASASCLRCWLKASTPTFRTPTLEVGDVNCMFVIIIITTTIQPIRIKIGGQIAMIRHTKITTLSQQILIDSVCNVAV